MKGFARFIFNCEATATEANTKMQAESANSEHSIRNGRQDDPPRQAQREMRRLSIRHSFSHEASSRRKRIFCLCILCWLMVLCLTGIIIIAVVHFQSSESQLDQISAGALIGFGLLLIVVLGWSAIIYARFQKGSANITRPDSGLHAPREEILAFASSEVYPRGASTISTNNSMSHSDSSTEGNNGRFIYRERRHDDERRVMDPANTRHITDPPIAVLHRTTRMLREYQERGPGVARPPQVLHFPERPRVNTDPPRVFIDPNRVSRQIRRHSNPLPPPYQPPIGRPSSESLPMGFPPPAYDRVFGRNRRSRCESTASEESTLYPPDYQSRPPSPSPLPTTAATERRTSLSVLPDRGVDRPRISLGNQISTLPPLGRGRRLDSSTCEAHQPSPFPASNTTPVDIATHHSPSRMSPGAHSAAQASASAISRYPPSYFKSVQAPHHHPSSHSSSSPLHSPMALAPRIADNRARSQVSSPMYVANNRSLFSRPTLALTAPENTIQEIVDNEEESGTESRNESSRSGNQVDDQTRPSVVLVYLSQSQEEEMIV